MQWSLIAVTLFIASVIASFFLQRREKPRHAPERVILSSPRIKNLPETLTALSALGLDVSEPPLLDAE